MKRSTLLRCLPLLLLVLASCSSDPKALAKRYVDNGNKFFDKAKYKEAGLMYRKAIAKSPLSGEAYYRMGLTDLKLGGLGESVGMFRRAFELQPKTPMPRCRWRTYLYTSHQWIQGKLRSFWRTPPG